jgi:hypothetical protein
LLDEIGAFFAEAADRALWNDAVAVPSERKQQQEQEQRPPPRGRGGPNNTQKKPKTKKKHWKDKWEERIDYMFGLHNDNEPYRRWTDRPAPPEPIVPSPWRSKRKDGRDEPFWGRGSLLSLVLSRDEPQLYPWDRVDALWESNSGSVLTILRWGARGAARWYGKACRWASYHETLPQPAVVTFVTAILLSTTKRRLLAAAIALVATRAIGEAVRGEITPWDDIDDDGEDKTAAADDDAADEGIDE